MAGSTESTRSQGLVFGEKGRLLIMFLLVSVFFFSLGRNTAAIRRVQSKQELASAPTADNIVEAVGAAVESKPIDLQNVTLKPTSIAAAASVSLISSQHGVATRTWENWPAVAYEESGHPLVVKGDSFFNHARELYFEKDENGRALINEFLDVYKNRPDPVNLCGIRINHAMALFLAVKQINPSLVVESGVNAGVSTYFIRAASNTTKIFAIDPLEKPICSQPVRWIDHSNKTTYYTGGAFVDLMDLDWKGMVERREIDPEKTLVFIDDHLHAFKRTAGVMKYGVRHVLIEDNYKVNEGATPNDKVSTPKQMFYGEQWKKEGNWLFAQINAYAEFPPIVPPIVAKAFTGTRKAAGGFMVAADENTDIVAPILRPDINDEDRKMYEEIAIFLEINPTLEDNESYMQFMNYNQICHLELLPIPDSLLYSHGIGG